jgi:hypothetical protein
MAPRIAWLALACGLLSIETRAEPPAPPSDDDYTWGQDVSAPQVFNARDQWFATWTRENGRIQEEWQIDFAFDAGFRRYRNHQEQTLGFRSSLGTPRACVHAAPGVDRTFIVGLTGDSPTSSTAGTPCGEAVLEVAVKTSRPVSPFRDLGVPDHPECGKRMVALTEHESGVDYYSCVDRPWPRHPNLTMITYVLEGGRLTWVYSSAPFAVVPDYAEVDAMPQLPWSLPATCHPYFRTSPDEGWRSENPTWEYARKNLAFNFAWDDAGELVWAQAWQDDTETGPFVVYYPDGMPQVIGARYDGQAHGLWYYLAPDGTLIEARLYGLGVELEQLPVETVRKGKTSAP